MKSYTKPEVINATDGTERAFPAVGLALAGGYIIGKLATGLGKAIGDSVLPISIAIPESVIA